MADRKACVYLFAYDCRCDDSVDCPILLAPPGTYPLRLPDDGEVARG